MKGLTSDQNGDFENTPIFPSEENWLGFRRRLSFPFGQGTMPAPWAFKRFSPSRILITQ
ncbi:hypothetical protein ACFLT2_13645 [Acidobacteriota bacterium]